MPYTSPEAIERYNRKRREQRAALKGTRFKLKESDLPQRKVTKRRMMPKLPPNTSKADLREMIATAMANTGKR